MDNVIQNINIEDIVPNNYQHQYDMKEIEELASSIKKHGLLEPITLRKKDTKYELILGNKRYKAAIIAGLKTIPAIIKKMDDNQAKEYLMISNETLVLNNISFSNSNEDNLDVINLSKLNKEYERDDFKMNNNQFDNNIQQPINNGQNEPTFGGRFFPSLEDEPTNMNFGATNNTSVQSPVAEPISTPTPQSVNQSSNNFIDLTDLNITPQNVQTFEVPQNNFVEPTSINNTNSIPNVENQHPQTPASISNGNIINLENLKQNSEMGTQPINIDNNFQNVINDFNPNNNMIQDQVGQSQMNTSTPSIEKIPVNNIDFTGPTITTINKEPIISNIETENIMNVNNQIQPEIQQSISQKDVTPVINTLKALAVNLENFGYSIRITDENLQTSYKITIEVEK